MRRGTMRRKYMETWYEAYYFLGAAIDVSFVSALDPYFRFKGCSARDPLRSRGIIFNDSYIGHRGIYREQMEKRIKGPVPLAQQRHPDLLLFLKELFLGHHGMAAEFVAERSDDFSMERIGIQGAVPHKQGHRNDRCGSLQIQCSLYCPTAFAGRLHDALDRIQLRILGKSPFR